MFDRALLSAFGLLAACTIAAQGGDAQLRARANTLFTAEQYAEALPLYSQLVSNEPADRDLNYRFGTCILHGGGDRERAIGYLKYATEDPAIPSMAWYWLGRAYHLNYRFGDALNAYQRFRGTGDRKAIAANPVDALEKQCRNGQKLLSSLKEVTVHAKVEVADREFFRYYDLEGIGGRLVVTPDELKTTLDKKYKGRSLIHLPDKPGPLYFSSYGKDGKTGRDIYRTELLPSGTFATPVRLAGFINTDEDEDFPYMHPDGKTFYFSSKGHNSMGGYDVFRSRYDRGMDVFSMPENLDFAVNTPDDDVLYIVDGEGRQACFASARASSQGNLHVYRVSTDQVPIVLTVLRGTFASDFDKQDRKARIVVEDGLTREVVADVRTDINGSYILSLPRSGRYRFLVEAGPTGRTHAGIVEVPRSDVPKAYRQELQLVDQGGQERLVIRNYFDEPLDGDLIAMALEEIKRRARLDVGPATTAPVEAPTETPMDLMSQAGFTGDMTPDKVVKAVAEDAARARTAAEQERQASGVAFTTAVAAATEADRASREAADLWSKAQQEADARRKADLVAEASAARKRARDANMRARAALETGQDLDAASLRSTQRAQEATDLERRLTQAVAAGNGPSSLPVFVEARERIEQAKRPERSDDASERARRMAREKELEAARAMASARSKRAEEDELADRLNRLEREMEETKSRPRKEELGREVTEYRTQLAHLRQETERAFTKAQAAERDAEVQRGKVSLLAEVMNGGRDVAATEADAETIAALGERIASNEGRIAAIAIDQRAEGGVTVRGEAGTPTGSERDLASAAGAAGVDRGDGTERPETRADDAGDTTAQRVDRKDAPAGGATGSSQDATEGARDATATTARTDASTQDQREAAEGATNERVADGSATRNSAAPDTQAATSEGGERSNTVATDGARDATTTAQRTDASARDQRAGADQAASERNADGTSVRASDAPVAQTATTGDSGGADKLVTPASDPRSTALDQASRGTEAQARDARSADTADAQRAGEAGDPRTAGTTLTPEQIRDGELPPAPVSELERSSNERARLEQERFLAENRLAELAQLEQATKDRSERERLTAERNAVADRVAAIENELAALSAAAGSAEDHAAERAAEQGPGSAPALTFDADLGDDPLAERLMPGVTEDMALLKRVEDMQERNEAMADLERMLLDSIDAQVERQLAVLEADASKAPEVLPRVERLRVMKLEHQRRLDNLGSESAMGSAAARTEGQPASPVTTDPATATQTMASGTSERDPAQVRRMEERYVAVTPDPIRVYESRMVPRSTKTTQAMAELELETGRMADAQLRVDSLEEVLSEMEWGRERDKLRKSTDKLIDDLLIDRTSAGQRTAFITREEMRAMEDSLRRVKPLVDRKGAAPNEPLLVMATRSASDARSTMSRAQELRKNADRIEDIIKRDSLYRRAYSMELQALRDMDRAITIQTYMAGDAFVKGESLTIAQIEERLFGTVPTDAAIAQAQPQPAVPTIPGSVGERSQENRVENPAGAQVADQAVPSTTAAAPTDPRGQPRYREYLGSEPGTLTPLSQQAEQDPNELGRLAEEAMERSREQEMAAQEKAAEAQRKQAAMAGASKRERERMESEAARDIALSDSLTQAALRSAEEARAWERQQRDAEEARAFADRLRKYYYLSGEDYLVVMDTDDHSRYFKARTKAMEQAEAADLAKADERTFRQLADDLRQEERKLQAAAGQRDEARIAELSARAVGLEQRADSLSAVSQRLRTAARINEDQAGLLLQGLDAERSSTIMALEQRARREEPVLAQARAVSATERSTPPTAPGTGQPLRTDRTAEEPAAVRDAPVTTTEVGQREERSAEQPARPVADRMEGERASAPSTTVPGGAGVPTPVVTGAKPWEFPMPEELREDLFAIIPTTERRSGPIPVDAPMPQGLVYKVQIGAFREAIKQEAFSDLAPVTGESTGTGLTRYSAGLFTTFDAADQAKGTVRGRGYSDAFVVAYLDGRRIGLAEARRLQGGSRDAAIASTTAADARPATATAPATGSTATTTVETPVVATAPVPSVPVDRPSTVVTPAPDDAALLAKYPPTAAELMARFVPAPDAASYYNEPGAAPARQVETLRGLFFTVQVGVYSKPVALDKLFNITPLNSERITGGKIRYTTGIYRDLDKVRARRDQAVGLGVKDAFITAYLNGERIPFQEARALLERFGTEVLVAPQEATP